MNNVEIYEDFLQTLKQNFPNIQLDQRDKMLLGMAVNHTYLHLQYEEKGRDNGNPDQA
ncbi:hypothetical protein HWC53_gp141 [Bacillus phage vB_BmeM-Goe8]|uniref:Uncharacterized protein n=1 Tax=Bacillus phage vB_BmeM-Goe8 TaxID=2593638 RepID=A0A516KMW5_9CAUD|nr:hypothetical protein HWC53_gp141 [Bacillus phage vB_BmeM-Goe8]QDP42948.1 hypothetical protein Goe8_c01750 [Bacillus phage vB_BmeM-Goe8]